MREAPRNDRITMIAVMCIVAATIGLVVTTHALQEKHMATTKGTEQMMVDIGISNSDGDTDDELSEQAVIHSNDNGSNVMEHTDVARPATDAKKLRFEAEQGKLEGTSVATTAAGYSGEGYVTEFFDEADSVHIAIEVEEAGLYTLYVGYRAANGYKESELYVNDAPFGKVVLKESSSFTNTKVTRILLEQGKSILTFTRGWGYFDLDYVELERFDTSQLAAAPITEKLSNSHATPEAVALMNYLNEHAGKSVISGQQLYTHIIDIEQITGKRPAIVGFDFIEYSPTRAAYGSRSSEVESALSWHKQGGIVSFLWHWNAPTGLIDEPGKEWWRGFYTDAVTFSLADALKDTTSEQYQLLLSDMDAIAQQIKILQLNDVPILFRPLHEAEGGWFWWGASGPEAAKELYRLMYDRFVNEHKLNNLIWVWNSVDPAWYPGDDVVDIVSYDSYPVAGDHNPVANVYDALVELTGGSKYIAMMENGSIPDPDAMEAYGANWGLFITWNGHFTLDGEHNSKEFLHHVYNHPRVITLEDLPNFKEKNENN